MMPYRSPNYSGAYCGYDDSMYMDAGMSPAANAMVERKIVDVLSKMLGNSMNYSQDMEYQMPPFRDDQRYGNQDGKRRKKRGKTGEDESKKQNEKKEEKGEADGKKTKKAGPQKTRSKKDAAAFEPRSFCYICNLECRSEKDLECHLSGRRHKLSVEGSDKIVGRSDQSAQPFCKFCCVQFTEKDWATHKETAEHKAKSALKVKVPRYSTEPEGVEFIMPVSGFYCKLCHRFYTDEDTAKSNHCKSREHIHKVQRDKLVRQYDAEMREYLAKKKGKKAEDTTEQETAKQSEDSNNKKETDVKEIQQANGTTQEENVDDKNADESAVKDEYRMNNSE